MDYFCLGIAQLAGALARFGKPRDLATPIQGSQFTSRLLPFTGRTQAAAEGSDPPMDGAADGWDTTASFIERPPVKPVQPERFNEDTSTQSKA